MFLLLTQASIVYGQGREYTPLESIPGGTTAGVPTTLGQYLEGFFDFALMFVGASALLMIVVGGFWYMASAGNQAQATTAKKMITDALLGLFVVLFAVLILNVINPDLTTIQILGT